MANEVAVRDQLPARARNPWEEPGARGGNAQLLFDPDRHELWVRIGERFHFVCNIAVEELTFHVDYFDVYASGIGDIHVRDRVPISRTQRITLRGLVFTPDDAG